MENEDNGITLGQLFKVIFGRNKKRKITFCAVFAGVFVVLALGIKLFYNKSVDTYTAKFNWTVVGLNDGKYVDGSTFDYKDLQKEEVLDEIKSSDQEFSSINIEKLTGNLSIEYVKAYDTTQKEITDTYYLIKVNKKMFASGDQAKDFVRLLAEYPIKETIKKLDNVNLTSNFTAFDNSTIYDNQVTLLNNQYNMLNSKYESLIETYGDVSINYNGSLVAVSSVKQDMTTYYNNYSLAMLQTEINNYGYVKDFTYYEATIKAKLSDLLQTYKTNLYKYKSIKSARDSLVSVANQTGVQDLQLESYNTEMVKLITENKDIISDMIVNLRKLARDKNTYANQEALEQAFKEIASIIKSETDGDTSNDGDTSLDPSGAFDYIYSNVNSGNVANYEAKLEKYYDDLKNTYTSDFSNVQKQVVTNYSKVSFYSGSIVELNEGLSLVKNLLLSLVAGLVVACVTNLVLDYQYLYEDKKKKDNE